ncbi:MAG: hypothetical protein E4H13_05285 [Calditrichales bacterium]|nr:MAG: hypothetical protein E4H13_05285 [Calditrichales bacterium]
MKNKISVITFIALAMLLIIGCANWGGDNPMGITGGSEQGYGKSNDLDLPAPESGPAENLVGTWRHNFAPGEYEIIEFKSNGKFTIDYYENYRRQYEISGNFTTSGKTLTFWIEGQPSEATYTLINDRLSLTLQGETTIFDRV